MMQIVAKSMRPKFGARARTALGAAAFALSALAGGAVGAADIQRGGTIVQAEWIAVPSLDPHLSNAVTTVVWANIFDTLFTYTPPAAPGEAYKVGPGLAKSFKDAGGNLIEVKLREGATFHDGTPIDAEAIKWNLEYARDTEQSTRKETVKSLTDVKVIDSQTLHLQFDNPQPLFDVLFSKVNPATIYFASPTAYQSMGPDAFAAKPVGSGPFKVIEYKPDDRITLEKFDGYWAEGADGKSLPYADNLTIRFIPDQSVGALELRAGTVHVADLLPQDVTTLADNADVDLYTVPLTDKAYPSMYIASSDGSKSPFAEDVRLRQAVQHAINREAVAKVVGFGNAVAHYHWGWYPGVPGYDETLPKYEYDPEKSKKLLAEAGYPDGLELEVKVINRPTDVQPLEIMQAMLAEVGIDLKVVLLDRTPWIESGRAGNFVALSHGNTANLEPLMRKQTLSSSSSNWAHYKNPDVDALWDEAGKAGSVEGRAAVYKKMQRIMHDDAYHFVAYRLPIVRGHSAKLHGIEATGGNGMGQAWLEQ